MSAPSCAVGVVLPAGFLVSTVRSAWLVAPSSSPLSPSSSFPSRTASSSSLPLPSPLLSPPVCPPSSLPSSPSSPSRNTSASRGVLPPPEYSDMAAESSAELPLPIAAFVGAAPSSLEQYTEMSSTYRRIMPVATRAIESAVKVMACSLPFCRTGESLPCALSTTGGGSVCVGACELASNQELVD